MKIIDLLNKIANGEEVPEKIRFDNTYWNRVYGEKNVCYIDEYDNDFFLHFFRNNLDFTLNDEVEIIEEDKKIEKIKLTNGGLTLHLDNKDLVIYEKERHYINKINEIIDKVNKIGE